MLPHAKNGKISPDSEASAKLFILKKKPSTPGPLAVDDSIQISHQLCLISAWATCKPAQLHPQLGRINGLMHRFGVLLFFFFIFKDDKDRFRQYHSSCDPLPSLPFLFFFSPPLSKWATHDVLAGSTALITLLCNTFDVIFMKEAEHRSLILGWSGFRTWMYSMCFYVHDGMFTYKLLSLLSTQTTSDSKKKKKIN